MNDWSTAAVFIQHASASCNIQPELRSIEVLKLISALGISIYDGPLLMITACCYVITARLPAMYQGWYTSIVWWMYVMCTYCWHVMCYCVLVCRRRTLPLSSSLERIPRHLFRLRFFHCLCVSSKHTRCVCVCDICVSVCMVYFL